MRPQSHSFRRESWLALALALAACGTTDPEVVEAPLARIWQSSGTGAREVSLRLVPGGETALVEADLTARTCRSRSGSWSRANGRLALSLSGGGASMPAEERAFTYRVYADSLVLDGTDGTTTYRPATRMPTCVEYGFGTWTGTLSAAVDGVDRDFGDVSVRAAVGSGVLEITSASRPCPTCEPEQVELLLVLDASPGALTEGSYTVQNVPGADRTFYALHDTHPGDTTFPGFDTSRLSPPGTFVLTSVAVDRVVGTFSFRANPVSDGLNAPDGRTTVLVTDGRVDLEYREATPGGD
jgi:hypothetical protein